MEAADLFLGKAASDLAAARLLAGDDDQEDDVVGFHAQLVVEKSLKAVVAVRSLEIPRSHDRPADPPARFRRTPVAEGDPRAGLAEPRGRSLCDTTSRRYARSKPGCGGCDPKPA
ncbi:MAG: HEPN domain-containing protein, partial [Solirubrobacterales bacterium]|nr:HEPN domain-containing protein [Solirubrobacterales bacterium]